MNHKKKSIRFTLFAVLVISAKIGIAHSMENAPFRPAHPESPGTRHHEGHLPSEPGRLHDETVPAEEAEWQRKCKTDADFLASLRKLQWDGYAFKLTKEQKWYLKLQRKSVQGALNKPKEIFFESDHVMRRLFLARVLSTHAIIYGEPGGGKTALAKYFLSIPTLKISDFGGDGKLSVRENSDIFSLQMNQMTSDAVIKGYLDPGESGMENSKGGQERIRSDFDRYRSMIKADGTLIHFEQVLLDEIDKGNPVAFAALMDVLNERVANHGPLQLKVKTKTLVCTSNMTLYELLVFLEKSGMGSTAKPLLDRIPYKILTLNQILDPALRRRYDKLKALARKKARIEQLSEVEIEKRELEAWLKNASSDMHPIDFDLIRALTSEPELPNHHVTESQADLMVSVMDDIAIELKKRYDNMRADTEAKSLARPELDLPVYFPPHIENSRNRPVDRMALAASLFVDLMAAPKELVTDDYILKVAEEGIPFAIESVWRLQDTLTTTVGADPVLRYLENGRVELDYGPAVEALRDMGSDARTKKMYEFAYWEKMQFKEVFEAVVNRVLESQRKSAENLSGTGGSAETLENPEKILASAAASHK